MNYITLEQGDETKLVNVHLKMSDLKILHNACIDILHEHPNMVSYNASRITLKEIINFNEANNGKLNQRP